MARKQFVRRESVRRLTSWFQFQPIEATMTGGGGTLYFTLNAAALALRPFTIVRTHFEFALRSDQAAAIELQTAGVGMAVVSDQASAIGVSAIPTPITDMAFDLWFLHTILMADESSLTDRTRPATYRSVDSKAMRKVDIGQDLVIVGELDATTSAGLILKMSGRILVKVN